jgi:hypothetical protein
VVAVTLYGRLTCALPKEEVSGTDSRDWTIGGLIAQFERAVGLYASLIGVNAYHEPWVEARKWAGHQSSPCKPR